LSRFLFLMPMRFRDVNQIFFNAKHHPMALVGSLPTSSRMFFP